MTSLTLELVPYASVQHLSSVGRIRKLLNLAKEDKIVLLEGRLRKDEETELIKATMEEINDEFKGIELAVIDPDKEQDGFQRFRQALANLIMGGDRQGFTIIGPANTVKEIKKDPNKIQLLTQEQKKKTKKKKSKKKKSSKK